MAVNDRDAAWAAYADDRAKVADILGGRETALGHIRALPGWEPDEFKAVCEGAYFLPMVARTAETFAGLIFAKSPTRSLPEALTPLLNDVTQTGQEIDRFAEQGYDAVLSTGAMMVLVDYPTGDGVDLTKAEAAALGRRVILRQYDGDSILAARKTVIKGVPTLTHVRLLETEEEASSTDDFAVKMVNVVRVLDLVDGVYQQRLFTQTEKGWVEGEVTIPRMNGQPLNGIPAFFCNTRDGEARPARPPLTDLADISIAHLNNSASYEWALKWLGNPVLFGAGVELAPGSKITLGSSSAILVPNAEAKLTIVQADASKFSGLKTAMDDKRRDAAALGARMLLEERRAATSTETARIERAGETSVVVGIANAVSQCLTNAIRFMAQWAGITGAEDGLYWLNTKVIPDSMTGDKLRAILEAWIKGAITDRDLFTLLQEGDMIDPAKTYDAHQDEKVEESPDPADPEDIAGALDPAIAPPAQEEGAEDLPPAP